MSTMTVFFDGSCPLCAREIAFYRRRDGARLIDWVDLTSLPEGEVRPGLTKRDARARFHVVTASGRVLSGGAAFAALWAGLSSSQWLVRLCRLKPMVRLLDAAYPVILKVRRVFVGSMRIIPDVPENAQRPLKGSRDAQDQICPTFCRSFADAHLRQASGGYDGGSANRDS